MGTVAAWGLAGFFLLVAVVLLTLMQKSRGDLKNNIEEVSTLRESYDDMNSELVSVRAQLKEKTAELETLQNEFDERMDKVVQSSLLKIEHAEQAKEEAIQAAQDNLETATEIHAQLKEKEELITRLQEQFAT